MYIMKFHEQEMFFSEWEYKNNDMMAFLKYSGYYDKEQVKTFILHALELAEGNPIKVEIPLCGTVLESIEDMGLNLNKKGYLNVPYLGLTKVHNTALKLLNDGYIISMKDGELEIH